MPAPDQPIHVLFVCMGNICRSPAAEIVFRHLVEQEGLQDAIRIDSAGTIGYHAGNPPDPRMSATLERRGYSISGRSRRFETDDFERFDHILVADEDNLHDILRLDPSGSHHQKVRLLTDHCTEHEASHVPDPYYGGGAGFEKVADLVEDACAGLLDSIRPD